MPYRFRVLRLAAVPNKLINPSSRSPVFRVGSLYAIHRLSSSFSPRRRSILWVRESSRQTSSPARLATQAMPRNQAQRVPVLKDKYSQQDHPYGMFEREAKHD